MDVFTALADPTRRRLVELLGEGEQPAGALVAEFPQLTQPAVSRHLRVLRVTGLVSSRAVGTQRRYRLERQGLEELRLWIARYDALWSGALDSLESHVRDSKAHASTNRKAKS